MDIRKYFALIFIIFVNLKDSSCSNIPIDYSAMSNLLQSRIKRDDDYKVKCHQSHTGNKINKNIVSNSYVYSQLCT